MLNRKCIVTVGMLAVALLCLGQPAQAFIATTNGVTTYDNDGFEDETVGTRPLSPSVGSNVVNPPSTNPTTVVTDAASPGPAEGSKYVKLTRIDASTYIKGTLSSAASGSDVVRVTAMVYIPDETGGAQGFSLQLRDTDGVPRAVISTKLTGDGTMQYEGSGGTLDSTVNYLTDTWQEWTLEADLGTGLTTFWVDGVQGETFAPAGSAGPGNDSFAEVWVWMNLNGGTAYVDTIPEPASLGLVGIGAAMIVARHARGSR